MQADTFTNVTELLKYMMVQLLIFKTVPKICGFVDFNLKTGGFTRKNDKKEPKIVSKQNLI